MERGSLSPFSTGGHVLQTLLPKPSDGGASQSQCLHCLFFHWTGQKHFGQTDVHACESCKNNKLLFCIILIFGSLSRFFQSQEENFPVVFGPRSSPRPASWSLFSPSLPISSGTKAGKHNQQQKRLEFLASPWSRAAHWESFPCEIDKQGLSSIVTNSPGQSPSLNVSFHSGNFFQAISLLTQIQKSSYEQKQNNCVFVVFLWFSKACWPFFGYPFSDNQRLGCAKNNDTFSFQLNAGAEAGEAHCTRISADLIWFPPLVCNDKATQSLCDCGRYWTKAGLCEKRSCAFRHPIPMTLGTWYSALLRVVLNSLQPISEVLNCSSSDVSCWESRIEFTQFPRVDKETSMCQCDR